MLKLALIAAVASVVAAEYQNEFVILPGHTRRVWNDLPMPVEYIKPSDLPAAWDWSNINGTSYITKSLNQHIPQYCGSCWAHGALSSLADRVKIARKAQGQDINLSIQFILNCAGDVAGSCHGGSASGVYQFVKETGYVPYDTCMNYEACSRESNEGRCRGGNWECSAINTCRTCNTFTASGGQCREIAIFPNVTVSNYGDVPNSVDALKAEIFARGPVACGVNATPLVQYTGGVYDNKFGGRGINHIVSIVGWGVDSVSGTEFWRVRNSWGEFWGELGFFRIATGNNQLGIEEMCSWATPGSWTEHNYPCYEDGTNCVKTAHYVDPAVKVLGERARNLISALQP